MLENNMSERDLSTINYFGMKYRFRHNKRAVSFERSAGVWILCITLWDISEMCSSQSMVAHLLSYIIGP